MFNIKLVGPVAINSLCTEYSLLISIEQGINLASLVYSIVYRILKIY